MSNNVNGASNGQDPVSAYLHQLEQNPAIQQNQQLEAEVKVIEQLFSSIQDQITQGSNGTAGSSAQAITYNSQSLGSGNNHNNSINNNTPFTGLQAGNGNGGNAENAIAQELMMLLEGMGGQGSQGNNGLGSGQNMTGANTNAAQWGGSSATGGSNSANGLGGSGDANGLGGSTSANGLGGSTAANGLGGSTAQTDAAGSGGSAAASGNNATSGTLKQPDQNVATPGFTGPGLNATDPTMNVKGAAITTNGDPHIASNIDGKKSWSDNMGSQSDLIDANNSFAGGYQESTQVGNAGKDGKTFNKEIDFQVGGAKVSATGNKGDVSVSVQNGPTASAQTLSKGESLTTSEGATITLDKSGKLEVTDNNETGGTLTTTVSSSGKGLDATSSGSNIDLGGFAAAQNAQQVQSGSGDGKKDIGL